ncbi:MAG TPA: 3-phosphoshikimate 1-carboxyvinyltransferase, partial [Ktedonobacterales bacterium]|nr:3-phosphoshikimate 1-carboxyvinyltransferase [Ktedonobacterales bacterium]
MSQRDEPANKQEGCLPETVFVRRGTPRATPVTLSIPGAKYYTLRYLLAALLADGVSRVRNPARSDDTRVLLDALRALGADVAEENGSGDGDPWTLRIIGTGGKLRQPPGNTLAVGNAGAVLRMLLGVGALLPEITFTTDHPQSLGRRPNADLLDALAQLGIQTEANGPEGLLPITLRGGPPAGGAVTVSGARSSQYLSALLFLAPLLPQGMRITVSDGLRSSDLVRASLRVLAESGIQVAAADNLRAGAIAGGQTYRAHDVTVPGDVPSAAALAVAALALGQPARLTGLGGAQPEMAPLVAALEGLGASLTQNDGGSALTIGANGPLRGVQLDGDPLIDSIPVLVAAACFAEGESRFENVAHLRLKESDRIGDLCAELQRAGCDVEPMEDGILVRGQPAGGVGGVTVDAHDDHRL